jgi:SAM-dependent methyltransferase
MTVIPFPAPAADEPEFEAHTDLGRLRASPNFTLAFSFDGRPYVASEAEPYTQYWLTEPERVLLSLFSGRNGEIPERAIGAYLRLAERPGSLREITRLAGLVARMRATGVLVGLREDTSRYDLAMAEDYLKHRPFPAELAELIVREAQVGEASHVLDLAGGPGVLALALAATSRHVALMDLSRGFITATGREATRRGLKLKLIHDSAHRLAVHEDAYDVIALSQTGGRLDDLLVCRGVGSVLRRGGGFFVVLSGASVRGDHPLAYLLGENSILGRKPPGDFADRARGRMLRLSLLFKALSTGSDGCGGGEDPIVPAGLHLFRQTRPFGLGYARAFMSPREIAATGVEPRAFWSDLDLRCVMATRRQLLGVQDWAVLHFRRGGEPWTEGQDLAPAAEIDWTGPFDD